MDGYRAYNALQGHASQRRDGFSADRFRLLRHKRLQLGQLVALTRRQRYHRAITNITFAFDSTTNKYVATLTLDSSGLCRQHDCVDFRQLQRSFAHDTIWDAPRTTARRRRLLGQRPGRRFGRENRTALRDVRGIQHLLLGGDLGGRGHGAPRRRHGRERPTRTPSTRRNFTDNRHRHCP